MIECPYCENEQDDPEECFGDGDEQEVECWECEKHFIVRTAISVDFEPRKADCLNGAPHDYQLAKTFPAEFAEMRCVTCGEKK